MTTNPILQLTEEDFEKEVLQSDQPVLVDFWADWCQPCHVLAPTIEQLAEAYDGSVKVAKVDVDPNQGLASTYDISSIPTVILFKDGRPAERLIGVKPQAHYEQALNALLG